MKTFRFTDQSPAVWRIRVSDDVQEARRIIDQNGSIIRHFVQGQRQHYDVSNAMAPYWKKTVVYDDLRITYTNRQGQEIITIQSIAEPEVLEESTTEEPTPKKAPDFLIVSVDPTACYTKADISVMHCISVPAAYGRTLVSACCSVDAPGGNTNQYVSKFRTGWFAGSFDPFDYTGDQLNAYYQSFQLAAPEGATSGAGQIGIDVSGKVALGFAGEVEITGALPAGEEITLEAMRYSSANIDNITDFGWDNVADYRLFAPWYRLWQESPGGHPVEELIDQYYDAIDEALAAEGQPPGARPTIRYTLGTTVNMLTTWDKLTGPYCNGYRITIGITCVTYPVGLFDGATPRILTDETPFWPMNFSGCRANDIDGTVPPPPTMDYDMIGGLGTLFTQWHAFVGAPLGYTSATPWGTIASEFAESIPNGTTSGTQRLLRASGQVTYNSSTPAANIVETPWDFSGVTATWKGEGISAEYVCTGYGVEADNWSTAASWAVGSSPLLLVLSKVE